MRDSMNPVYYPRQSANIFTQRYNLIKNHILTILEDEGPDSLFYIKYRIMDKLFALFEGRVEHYIDLVINDLLKHQVIEKVAHSRSEKVRIKR